MPSTVNGLQDKLTAAKAIAQAPQSQEEIDEQTAILREARLSARTLADKEALIAAVHNASLLKLDRYTADSAKRVRSLLDQAQEVLNDPEVTQEDVDTITASLNRAVSHLEARPQSDTESGKPLTDPARDEQAASSLSAESDTAASVDHLGWIGLLLTCAAVLLCIRKRSIR
ncbi:MAG TPA: FIVAR domain-containing protein [Candidatus Merdibacter merdavium]|uniref:FIVAR domain-containing protein n=1 Tax=Candidatus Merdibacter merdavium TaxID=2838692 RepID=A0A9D2NQC5_9FIRM|nr:FIVAR domain-containing protein [Candidatus Merdibacter merdavium]